MRSSQRDIGRGTRDLEREVLMLKREEAKLVKDIKLAAKRGDAPTTKVLARSLVRLRHQVAQIHASAAQLRGVRSSMTVCALSLISFCVLLCLITCCCCGYKLLCLADGSSHCYSRLEHGHGRQGNGGHGRCQ